MLKKLRHERIVLFYGHVTEEVADGHGKTTTFLHIFMEYMPGVSYSFTDAMSLVPSLATHAVRHCTVLTL